MLEGMSSGGHFGLIILLREGVAAWMEHDSAAPMTAASASPERPLAMPIVCDEIHAEMVGVLASMAMVISKEMCAHEHE